MGKIKGSEVVDYSLQETFEGFMKVTKKEFRRFDDKNPVGSKFERVVKQNQSNTLKMMTKVSAYEKDKLYESESVLNEDVYISRYTFEDIGDEMTRITLEEIQKPKNFMSKVGVALSGLTGGSKVKTKLKNTGILIVEEIERKKKNINKNNKRK